MSRFKKLITGEITPWVSKEDLSKVQIQLDKLVEQLDTHELKLDVLKNNQRCISQTTDLSAEAVEDISNNLSLIINKTLSIKHTVIAISSWALFFVTIGLTVYVIVSYL